MKETSEQLRQADRPRIARNVLSLVCVTLHVVFQVGSHCTICRILRYIEPIREDVNGGGVVHVRPFNAKLHPQRLVDQRFPKRYVLQFHSMGRGKEARRMGWVFKRGTTVSF